VAVTKDNASMVDSQLLNKAINALIKHHEKQNADDKLNLLGNEEPVHVQFTLSRIPEQTSARPIRVTIPHSIHKLSSEDGEQVEVCLFVKDESKEWVKEMVEKFPSHLSCVKKIITLTSLRKKYAQYKDKRDLLKKFSIFMADDRILPMLGKTLGKNFFQEKKQPIPIKLTRKEAFPFTVQKSLNSSTFMHISAGTCISIKAGDTSMSSDKILENISAVVNGAIEHIPRKWGNVSAINIKTSNSMALPIYNKTREELEEITRLAKISRVSNSEKKEETKSFKETAQSLDQRGKDENIKDDDQEKKKAKKELATKSPLAKALKKAVAQTEHVEKKVDTDGKKKKLDSLDDVPPISAKKAKKEETAKEKKETKSTTEETKKDFVASKKFNGAKKGYVFRKGKEGLGYYIDKKPIVDKMAIEALARLNRGSGGESSTRRKSAGGSGGQGKRKGRRSF